MRTNIEINPDLLEEAMMFTGLPTKRAVVEKALADLVGEARRKRAIENLWGIGWEGDLEEMRLEHPVGKPE
ncbi:type II toxin-antitoxin system VapB family antitoxin [Rhizobium sp.]